MDIKSWFEPNIEYLQKNWKDVKFDRELGVYFLTTDTGGLRVCLKGIVKFEDFHKDLEIHDTKWIVAISDGVEDIRFTVDLKKYMQPFWWAHFERPDKNKFYSQDDLHDVAHFIANIWTRMYLANKKSYGHVGAAWMAGFNFV